MTSMISASLDFDETSSSSSACSTNTDDSGICDFRREIDPVTYLSSMTISGPTNLRQKKQRHHVHQSKRLSNHCGNCKNNNNQCLSRQDSGCYADQHTVRNNCHNRTNHGNVNLNHNNVRSLNFLRRRPRENYGNGGMGDRQRAFVFPTFDPAIFDDDRTFQNMLLAEKRTQPVATYFSSVQTEIKEQMRRTLTEWLLEVVDEERLEGEIFVLAVSYLDRFLSVEAVHKAQLQVLGCACLFLASKVKQPQPLCARRLVEYTANSITLSELMSWELLVLNRLKWDLCTVTAFDYLDHIMHKLQLPKTAEDTLRPPLQNYVALVANEFRLAVLPPSVLAVSCLCSTFAYLLQDNDAARRMLTALRPIMKDENMESYEIHVGRVYSFLENYATMATSADLRTE